MTDVLSKSSAVSPRASALLHWGRTESIKDRETRQLLRTRFGTHKKSSAMLQFRSPKSFPDRVLNFSMPEMLALHTTNFLYGSPHCGGEYDLPQTRKYCSRSRIRILDEVELKMAHNRTLDQLVFLAGNATPFESTQEKIRFDYRF